MIPLSNFSEYFLENESIKATNQIQITSMCNAKCIFCSNEQNPFEIKRYDFRDPREIEKIIWATEHIDGTIHLNESLPGRISEGEALIHPKFTEILGIIRKKFKNPIGITTNASLLSEDMIQTLACFKPIEITISLHSTVRENWKNCFNLGDQQYETAVNSLMLLKRYGINFYASMVPLPSWFGYEDVEKTVKFFSDHMCREVLIYAPGYTKYTKPEVIEKLKFNKHELSNFFILMKNKYNIAFNWSLDPNKHLELNTNYIVNLLKKFNKNRVKESYWFTSVSAYERFERYMKSMNIGNPGKISVVPVENDVYGGNIECVGLWMLKDIKKKIKDLQLKNKFIVIPGFFLDQYGFDLMGENIVDVIKDSENELIVVR